MGSNLYHWAAKLRGPAGSPYEGGEFKLEIRMSGKYPMEPPKVKFKTPIFHPNINDSGEICLDVLKSQWSPALSLQKVILSISALLCEPNFSDPLNGHAASLYKSSKKEFEARCRDWVAKHAAAPGADARGKKRKAEE